MAPAKSTSSPAVRAAVAFGAKYEPEYTAMARPMPDTSRIITSPRPSTKRSTERSRPETQENDARHDRPSRTSAELDAANARRTGEHPSAMQSQMCISYAAHCLTTKHKHKYT